MNKKRILELFWEDFETFMKGQTVGRYDNGETDYYVYDVDKFLRRLKNG
jgi:hypothetical protein